MISHKLQNFHRKIVYSPTPSFFTLFIRGIFYLFSLIYLAFSTINSFCYKKQIFKINKISTPVISIGNIVAGGTGKTPLCIEVIKICQDLKILPALVSRGYGNDESKVYQKRFPNIPMAFSPNRFDACRNLLLKNPGIKVFVLDDAYQHQKIFRDLNILLINASDPFGQNYCLPRGFLRESLTAINRADLVILTHADEIATQEKGQIISKINSYSKKNIPVIEASHEPFELLSPEGQIVKLSEFTSLGLTKFGIICGIAQPEGFIKTLKKCHITPLHQFIYPDHYQYVSNDFLNIEKVKNSVDCLITTEKDIVKIPIEVQKRYQIYTLKMKMVLTDSFQLINLIKELVG